MLASLHLADVEMRTAATALRTPPTPVSHSGLRWATTMLTAPLSPSLLSRPHLRRVGLLAFWDTEEDLDAFVADDPAATRLAGGWHARLVLVRATGDWPGLTDAHTEGRCDGVAVTVTLGRLRPSQALRFLRASARAEAQALTAPGFLWGTAMARPPLVATCSLWQNSAALAAYAHRTGGGHVHAISNDQHKPFHHRSAFLRFRPYRSTGHLNDRNPLAADWATVPSR